MQSESDGETSISSILRKKGYRFEQEKEINNLKYDNLTYRRADFYLPEYDVYIEFLGGWDSRDPAKRSEERKRYREKKRVYELNNIRCIYIYPNQLHYAGKVISQKLEAEHLSPRIHESNFPTKAPFPKKIIGPHNVPIREPNPPPRSSFPKKRIQTPGIFNNWVQTLGFFIISISIGLALFWVIGSQGFASALGYSLGVLIGFAIINNHKLPIWLVVVVPLLLSIGSVFYANNTLAQMAMWYVFGGVFFYLVLLVVLVIIRILEFGYARIIEIVNLPDYLKIGLGITMIFIIYVLLIGPLVPTIIDIFWNSDCGDMAKGPITIIPHYDMQGPIIYFEPLGYVKIPMINNWSIRSMGIIKCDGTNEVSCAFKVIKDLNTTKPDGKYYIRSYDVVLSFTKPTFNDSNRFQIDQYHITCFNKTDIPVVEGNAMTMVEYLKVTANTTVKNN